MQYAGGFIPPPTYCRPYRQTVALTCRRVVLSRRLSVHPPQRFIQIDQIAHSRQSGLNQSLRALEQRARCASLRQIIVNTGPEAL